MDEQRTRARAASTLRRRHRASARSVDGPHGVHRLRPATTAQGRVVALIQGRRARHRTRRGRGGAGGARRARRSTPRAADRWATLACSRTDRRGSGSPTRRSSARRYGHIGGRLEHGSLKVGDMPSRPSSTPSAAMRRGSITPPRTCCTRRCARCWARTSRRRARWWRPDRLRFDFSHYAPVTPEELREIERLVNAEIRANTPRRDAPHEVRRRRRFRRDGVVRREIRRGRPRAAPRGFLDRALRRHPRRARGRHRALQIVSEGGIACRRAAHRGADRPGRARSRRRHGPAAARHRRPACAAHATTFRTRYVSSSIEAGGWKRKWRSSRPSSRAARAAISPKARRRSRGVKVVATTIDGADAAALRTAVDQLKSRLKSAAHRARLRRRGRQGRR